MPNASPSKSTSNPKSGSKSQLNSSALSVIADIFLPLGFLIGLSGINIAGIPSAENPAAFAIFCAMLGMLVIAQILLFRKLKWF